MTSPLGHLAPFGGPHFARVANVLVLEEADGLYNLLSGGNSGDAGDPFPGSAGNRSFGPLTYPQSHSNSRLPTPVSVSDISLELAADNLFNLPAIMLDWTSVVRATFVGGMFAPEITGVFPDTLDKLDATEAVLDIAQAAAHEEIERAAEEALASRAHAQPDGADVLQDVYAHTGE